MAATIRLKRMGSKKRPFYRLIAADSRKPRDGRFIETLGFYNPISQPAEVKVNEALVFKWFERGAVITTSAASLLRREGYLQKWELMKQGVTGDLLETRMESIRNGQRRRMEKREQAKKQIKSAKTIAKEAAAKEAVKTEATESAESAKSAKAAEPVSEKAPAKAAELASEEAPAKAAEPASEEAPAEAVPEEAAGEKTPEKPGEES
ncbi:MAG: 30S ribosomal protein S16 [bacterium]|nr:30S ribosomal protein S16 [bacterium]